MIDRRSFLTLPAALPLFSQQSGGLAPIPEPHFPNRLCQFVWRNWELANVDRLAEVAGTTPQNILELGAQLGLPPKPKLSDDQLRRIYITVIRQNWHVLPTNQLTKLLGWNDERLTFTLKEDDFLDVKVGRDKPHCEPIRYEKPTAEEAQAIAKVRQTVQQVFGKAILKPGEAPFQFVSDLSNSTYRPQRTAVASRPAAGDVDLTAGWVIEADAPLKEVAQRFSRYLRQAFSANVPVASTGARKISLRLAKLDFGREGSRTVVTDKSIAIEAADLPGMMQGIYALQDQMEQREAPFVSKGERKQHSVWAPRYLYSYFALYGDPLMEPEADPFPDAYLEKLARCGISGVWLQGVLNTLAPSKSFPEFGQGWETRLKNLNALVERAAQSGVKVYMYLNEPRAMTDAFFKKYPDIRGSHHAGLWAMCTSQPVVREWIADTLAHIFRQVPDLGGVFTISMSENHTNCFSHGGGWGVKAPNAGDCPRCSKRDSWDALAELLTTMRDGVRRQSATADIIHWDWGWPDDMTDRLLPKLPKDIRFQSISEWSKPVERGGVKTAVGEYSISVVGPGPRATRNWDIAKKAGISTNAKVQFNNTWEISAVPYIPVPDLILQHCEGLRKAGVSGLQVSWTCGGYPSPNLSVAKSFFFEPSEADHRKTLERAALQRYGKASVDSALAAWSKFSEAFQEFPYGVAIYVIPTQHGPANQLRLNPTGYRPSMMLFPHDGVKSWCGKYPPEVVQSQFTKCAAGFQTGIEALEKAVTASSPAKRRNANIDLAIAKTCYNHFQSTANQVEFYILRDAGATNKTRMRAIVEDEIRLARAQYEIARNVSLIGYEASNHYYYRPLDLVEKVLNCRQILEQLKA
ncbi:MAG: hypothetical protein IT168_27240 [Bryobacterales bacterium]|nr:hypothetical protein [Bryobacterales bacterium]